jgi:hypothetical protein
MLIDRTHRSWALGTAAVFLAASVLYVIYAVRSPVVSGGSLPGLLYGIAGFGLMVFAGLLSLRKKFPIWRIGRAQTWLRGHLWLGLLSFPLILFHAGFDFGGPLTRALMWLFVVVIVSGLLGAALQHYLPRTLTDTVPMETIYEQIPRVRRQLLDEGDGIVAAACGALEIETLAPARAAEAEAGVAEPAALATIVRVEADDTAPLREFYRDEMRPLLLDPARRAPLAEPGYARQRFDRLRTALPPELHPTTADLENICEEERQLERQLMLHHILHGWMLVHIPLSFALLALAAVHFVVALGY